jgi:hypothetical protein
MTKRDDRTPVAKKLLDEKAEAARAGFIAGYHYGMICAELAHPAKNIEDVAKQYAHSEGLTQ